MESLVELEPRVFLLQNLTSGSVSSAYASVLVVRQPHTVLVVQCLVQLAISFGIAAIAALLYYGLLGASNRAYGYSGGYGGYGGYSHDR